MILQPREITALLFGADLVAIYIVCYLAHHRSSYRDRLLLLPMEAYLPATPPGIGRLEKKGSVPARFSALRLNAWCTFRVHTPIRRRFWTGACHIALFPREALGQHCVDTLRPVDHRACAKVDGDAHQRAVSYAFAQLQRRQSTVQLTVQVTLPTSFVPIRYRRRRSGPVLRASPALSQHPAGDIQGAPPSAPVHASLKGPTSSPTHPSPIHRAA